MLWLTWSAYGVVPGQPPPGAGAGLLFLGFELGCYLANDAVELGVLLPQPVQLQGVGVELRKWFARYLWEYNYYRPHLSLQLKTPAEVVAEVVGG